ncbi:hypothetical protein [Hymenobacter koreensis]|uniref:Uncharacterized protein n=1 Tax=Hymenobacter koreensis TaxID=1084523 RepID=A0ABP8IVN7_9BACT
MKWVALVWSVWEARSGRYRAAFLLGGAAVVLGVLSLILENELWLNPVQHREQTLKLSLAGLCVLGWHAPYLLWRLAGQLPQWWLQQLFRLVSLGGWFLASLITFGCCVALVF